MVKHKGKRGSSKAGRPRKAGDRYACGKLKPPPQNERVHAQRAALLGTEIGEKGRAARYQDAENPMDLALARGWLTEAQHRAGAAYAAAHRAAGLGSAGMSLGGIAENDVGLVIDKATFREMTSAEVTAIFDQVFNSTGRSSADEHQAAAHARWKAMNAVLTPAQQHQIHLVCIMHSWPQWIVQRVAGHFDTTWERSREILVGALDRLARVLRPSKPAASNQANLTPEIKAKGPTRLIDRTTLVDEEGQVVRVVERRGALKPAAKV